MASKNREQWRKRVVEWKRSGLTAREYAARSGLNAGTLAYWKRQQPGKTPNLVAIELEHTPGIVVNWFGRKPWTRVVMAAESFVTSRRRRPGSRHM